jgi:hypothetical protein
MIQREHNQFKTFGRWDSELHNAVIAFKREHGAFPNILLANNKTFEAIDRVTKIVAPKNFFKESGTDLVEKPSSEVGGLNGFSTDQYKIDFCIDDKIPFSGYALIRDEQAQIEKSKNSQ